MNAIKAWLRWALSAGIILALPACAGRDRLPPPAVEVKVPVPVPCKIAEVARPEYPRTARNATIFDLVKTAMAERQLRIAEVERLRAAADGACLGGVK